MQPISVGVNNSGTNAGDQIYTTANTPATFTPQGESADGTPVQVSVQLFRGVPTVTGAYVDNSYAGTNPPADATNADLTLTQNGASYTVTPTNGDYGVQVLEVMGFTPVSGTFELQVGTTTTGSISFDSTNLATTAANIQSALKTAGFNATVTVDSTTTAPNFIFDVAFASSETNLTYVASSTALPVTFTNSATAATADQQLTFTDTGPAWEAADGGDPVYRSFVTVYVAPPAPQITSISVGGNTVTGSTFANNSSTATALTFSISGVTAYTTAVTGGYELQVGSVTTAAIGFDSSNPTTTASNMQTALQNAGFSNAAVAAVSATATNPVSFSVTFASSEAPVQYLPTSVALPVTFTNSVAAAATSQELTFDVAPISVSVYMDGGATPIATGMFPTGTTNVTLATNGTTKLADGNHTFTVEQSLSASAMALYAEWVAGSSGDSPGVQYTTAASSDSSPASAGTALTIGLTVVALPLSSVQVGVPYSYTVQTNAPSGDTLTVTPIAVPAGMLLGSANTFNWTPSQAQLDTAPEFYATVTDSLGNTVSIGPLDISVILGLPPAQIPVNSSLGGGVTVLFSGSNVLVYDSVDHDILSYGDVQAHRHRPDRCPGRPGEHGDGLASQQSQRRASQAGVGRGGQRCHEQPGHSCWRPGRPTRSPSPAARSPPTACKRRCPTCSRSRWPGLAATTTSASLPAACPLRSSYGRLQHAGLQPGHRRRGRQSQPR